MQDRALAGQRSVARIASAAFRRACRPIGSMRCSTRRSRGAEGFAGRPDLPSTKSMYEPILALDRPHTSQRRTPINALSRHSTRSRRPWDAETPAPYRGPGRFGLLQDGRRRRSRTSIRAYTGTHVCFSVRQPAIMDVMSTPNRRTVAPHPNGWAVERPGTSRASSVHHTQREAQDAGRDALRRTGDGELVTMGTDGRIRAKDTVPPGHDPFPPRG